jgi:hypothetical protein
MREQTKRILRFAQNDSVVSFSAACEAAIPDDDSRVRAEDGKHCREDAGATK